MKLANDFSYANLFNTSTESHRYARASQSLVPLLPDDFIDHLIMTLTYHQTLHFFLGFIGEPRGQLKAFENSGEFINVPLTL